MESDLRTDEKFMKAALIEAKKAAALEEVPAGAVIVKDGKVIARGHNLKELKTDTTEHAELIAIRKASKKLKNWRLAGCTLYTNLEPCPMCAGAMILARIERLVYGAADPKAGACGSRLDIFQAKLNHCVKISSGVLAGESEELLKEFFKGLRTKD